jgi:uncharacterized protein YkwD
MKKIWALMIVVLGISLASASFRQETDDFKDDFLRRINRVREQGCNCGSTYMKPVPPLVWNDKLEKAARGHAADMKRNRYFNHTSKDGRTMSDRIKAAGYTYTGFKSFAVGENIAFGQQSIQEVSDGWFESVGHCKNLMNPSFKEIGIAENGSYWVQDFGGRENFSEAEQKIIKNGGRLIMRQSSGHE